MSNASLSMKQGQEVSRADGSATMRVRGYWWGYGIFLNQAAVERLEELYEKLKDMLYYICGNEQVASDVVAVMTRKDEEYVTMALQGELVFACPWSLPLLLSPARAKYLPSNDNVYWTTFTQGTWSPAAKFPDQNPIGAQPLLLPFKGDLFMIHQRTAVYRAALISDPTSYYRIYTPRGGWKETKHIPGFHGWLDPVGCEFQGKLHIFNSGTKNESVICHTSWDGSGQWSETTKWERMKCWGTPAVATYNNQIFCVYSDGDGALSYSSFNGQSWSLQASMKAPGSQSTKDKHWAIHSLAVLGDYLYAVGSVNNEIWYARYSEKQSWGEWKLVSPTFKIPEIETPMVQTFKDRIFCVAADEKNQLYWAAYDGERWSGFVLANIDSKCSWPAIVSYNSDPYLGEEQLLCLFQDKHATQ